eukprot:7867391-Pyramimonas_sp.AAC.1
MLCNTLPRVWGSSASYVTRCYAFQVPDAVCQPSVCRGLERHAVLCHAMRCYALSRLLRFRNLLC